MQVENEDRDRNA
jgi:hypothetical protein